MKKSRECIATRCMAQIFGNVQVKAKLLIKPLYHEYFSQSAFACLKLTIETVEQGVKFVINKYTRMTSLIWRHYAINDIVLVSFTPYPTVSIVDFE